ISWLALVSTIAGIVLLVWVHIALGVHFSGTLHIRGDHELVQHGPYAWVRHPMYTSFLLLLGGLSALIANAIIGAVLLGSQVWVLVARLPSEEASLAKTFPTTWPDYRRRTGALLPRWSGRPSR
ncbi:MAG: isoprenylcysteine carboxylmethyltransferase family protein, partial [Myxococcota bacterium]